MPMLLVLDYAFHQSSHAWALMTSPTRVELEDTFASLSADSGGSTLITPL
jgi:hypothetical protein